MSLPIPSLAMMGVKRATPIETADLITIYKTPYPVIKNYKLFCSDAGFEPFAGGTHLTQGPRDTVGYVTSGFRDHKTLSPHGMAVALDVAIGDIGLQVRAAHKAAPYFNRIGLYPDNGFIHVDLLDKVNVDFYHKKKYWVRLGEEDYYSFDTLEEAANFATAQRG